MCRAALEILTCNCLKWQPVHFTIIDRLLAVMTTYPFGTVFWVLYADVLPDPAIQHPLSISDIKLYRLKGWHWKENVSFSLEQYEADHDILSVNYTMWLGKNHFFSNRAEMKSLFFPISHVIAGIDFYAWWRNETCWTLHMSSVVDYMSFSYPNQGSEDFRVCCTAYKAIREKI